MAFRSSIILAILALATACGEFPTNYDGAGSSYDRSSQSSEELAASICQSCLYFYSDVYLCELHLEREIRYQSCDSSPARYSDRCNDLFSAACAGEL
jgi:hypothetical protein